MVLATWSEDGETAEVADADRDALIFPWSWSHGDDVFVSGYSCPSPHFELDIDLADEDRERFCGGESSWVIRVLDVAERSWREVTPAVPLLYGRAITIIVPGGETLVVGGAEDDRAELPAIYEVDLSSGESKRVEGIESAGPWSGCELDGEPTAYRVTSTDPDGHAEGTFVRFSDGRAINLGSAADLIKIGCATSGLVMWNAASGSMHIASPHDGRIDLQSLDLPAVLEGDPSIRIAGTKTLDGVPRIWQRHEGSFVLWSLEGDNWIRTGGLYHSDDPPALAAVEDGVAMALVGSSPVTLEPLVGGASGSAG